MITASGSLVLLHLRRKQIVPIQDCSPPAAALPGLEWVRAVPPQSAPPAPTPDPRRTAV